ncbi:hypothetical protein CLD22_08405 [Rubrivivax gelatinosus]|nr:hypothetical protein [Rubrivivax gelatinosus]
MRFPHALIAGAALAMLAGTASAAEPADKPYALFDGLEQTAGFKAYGFLQVGISGNDASTHQAANEGHSTGPMVGPADEGLQLNALQFILEREVKSNIIPRATPLPGPMPQQFSWGFRFEGVYGRNGLAAMAQGLETTWGINETTEGVTAGDNRQNYLAFPQVYAQLYAPVGNGVVFTVGRFGAGIGYEIPASYQKGPNFFYSRTYGFVAQPDQVVGALASANLMNGPYGLLAAEFGVVNGRKNWQDNNDDKSLIGALRWRSSDMKLWVDYSFMRGNEQNDPGETVQAPVSRVISPRDQLRQHHGLGVSWRPDSTWDLHAEIMHGSQDGDGKAGTIDILDGNFYKGGSYTGLNAQLLYRSSARLQWGLRAETFDDPHGVALFPVTAAKGRFNAITAGLRYELTPNVVVRPELRHDWQDDRGALKAYGDGTKTKQTTVSADVLFYF